MSECIFCKLIQGEIPCTPVYEDEHVLAFDDIAPQAPVHVLIIPKKHCADVSDPALDDEQLCAVMRAIPKVAQIKGIDQEGYRLVSNKGEAAGQTVFHFHVHLLGGKKMSEQM